MAFISYSGHMMTQAATNRSNGCFGPRVSRPSAVCTTRFTHVVCSAHEDDSIDVDKQRQLFEKVIAKESTMSVASASATSDSYSYSIEASKHSMRGSAIHHSDNETDTCFILEENGVVGIVDAGNADCELYPSATTNIQGEESYPGVDIDGGKRKHNALSTKYGLLSMKDFIVAQVLQHPDDSTDIQSLLRRGFTYIAKPNAASTVLLHLDSSCGKASIAWTGTAGWLLIRDNEIKGSYTLDVRNSLEHRLNDVEPSRDQTDIHTVAFQSQEGDLIILGSDGFFDNCSDEQIQAFLRPVKATDKFPKDRVPSVSLAHSMNDDPVFLSYMLAHIAYAYSSMDDGMNQKTSQKTTRRAFSSHQKPFLGKRFIGQSNLGDDISIMCAVIHQQRVSLKKP